MHHLRRAAAQPLFLVSAVVSAVFLLIPAAASATPDGQLGKVTLSPCKEAKPDGQCGTVTVPLDHTDPAAGTVDVFFSFYPHTGPDPSSEAILITEGGPGLSVTQDPFLPGFYSEIFKPLRKTRDLILLDQRGVGKSGVIDCPKLQHGEGDTYAAVSECGAQLGAAANLYGSDSVAYDVDAVRSALGLDKLDFYGGSAAAMDIEAYATRFPEHLRSAVLDSPSTTVPPDPFDHYSPAQWLHAAQLICKRAPSCAREPGNAADDVAQLAERLREHPIKGRAPDASGKLRKVRVTEADLLWRILGNDGGGSYTAPSEIDAAARALGKGDPLPLLRLRAENGGPPYGDDGKPSQFSTGDNFARYCANAQFPWDKDASVDERRQQFEAGKAALEPDAFAPFSIDAWLAPLPTGPIGPDPCIEWPAPPASQQPPIPPGSGLPGDVPALVLTGDIDLTTAPETAHLLSDAWPNSRLITIKQAGHHTATPLGQRNDCSDAIIVAFIGQLDPGPATCAGLKPSKFPVVGRFAKQARQARAAKRAGGDRSTRLDRKIATVATAAATDTVRRSFTGPGKGAGLRGGSFETTFGDTAAEIDVHEARFARDVAVTGHVTYPFQSENLVAKLRVRGPGGQDGRLRISGYWYAYFHRATTLEVKGRLGGHRIHARVPAT